MRKKSIICFVVFSTFFICIVAIGSTVYAGKGALKFEKEKIKIFISQNEYKMVGDYYFNNHGSKQVRKKIFFPVIENQELPFPHFFKVTNVLKNKSVSFTKVNKGIFFWIEIPAFSQTVYRVEYHQKALNKKLEYILTTTSKWGKPLKSAEFLIEIPVENELEFISIPFDSETIDQKTKSYLIQKKNFNPQKNLIIEWRCRNDQKSN